MYPYALKKLDDYTSDIISRHGFKTMFEAAKRHKHVDVHLSLQNGKFPVNRGVTYDVFCEQDSHNGLKDFRFYSNTELELCFQYSNKNIHVVDNNTFVLYSHWNKHIMLVSFTNER